MWKPNSGVTQGRVRTPSHGQTLCETSQLAGAALQPPEPRGIVLPCLARTVLSYFLFYGRKLFYNLSRVGIGTGLSSRERAWILPTLKEAHAVAFPESPGDHMQIMLSVRLSVPTCKQRTISPCDFHCPWRHLKISNSWVQMTTK